MNRQKIEDKDQELLQKFRSVVHLKEQQNRQTRKRLFAIGMLGCCAVLVFLLGYRVFLMPSPGRVGDSEALPVVRKDAAEDPKEAAFSEAVPPLEGAGQAAESISAGTRHATGVAALSHSGETAAPGGAVVAGSGTPETEPGTSGSQPFPLQPVAGVRVAEIVACKGVDNRQYIAPQTVFSLEKDNRPDVWVWMDVRSDEKRLPYTLEHVYYVDGRKYAAVALNIEYPRMRTWSNITLKTPDLVGHWVVAVVADGDRAVSRVAFDVVP